MPRLALLPVFALLVACGQGAAPGHGHAQGQTQMPPMAVSVTQVIERSESEWADVSGRIEAAASVEVRPRVAGHIDEVLFTEGAVVKAKQPLYRIDQRAFTATVKRAEADVALAAARLAQATNDAKRADPMLAAQAISAEAAETRATALKAATAQHQAAEAALLMAQLDQEYANITAPIAGRIGRTSLTAGNLVSPGSIVLTTIVATDPVYVVCDLDERGFAAAQAALRPADGKPATVQVQLEGETGYPHNAIINFIDNRIDPATGTIRLRATLQNADGRIVPGGFARVRLPTSAAGPRLLIDQRAIATDQDRKYVLVVGADSLTAYRPVVLGPTVGNLRIVRDGVKVGETVVIQGSIMVRPGMPVSPLPEQPVEKKPTEAAAPAGARK